MNRLISFTSGAALAVAAMLAASPAAFAQHHGGMSGGAYHGGGGSFHTGNMGGFNGGYYHGGGGYYHGGGYYGGYGGYRGYGYGYGYPGFGLFIGLGGYGYGYGYGNDVGYSGYTSAYGNPDYGAGAQAQPQADYTPDVSTTARLDIRVPADAQVWVEGVQMKQTGEFRQLVSPPVLEQGKTYHYTVKATWTANGQPVTQERRINIQAGLASLVDFTKPESPDTNTLPTPKPANPAPITPPATTPPVIQTRVG